MKRLAQERPTLLDLRVVYADLDGTLLGPGGSLFATSEQEISSRSVDAVRSLHEAGIPLVLMSGRTRRGLREVARVLGAAAYIAELGALIVERDGPEETVVRNFGSFEGEDVPARAIARSGAGAYLLERYPGRLEPVAPWTEATLMFLGWVEPAEANEALEAAGYGRLELHDNGPMRRTVPALDVAEIHAMHLLPRTVDKASAVALHRRRHGIPISSAIAAGDSRSDLRVAEEVAAFFLMANGAAASGGLSVPENVYVTDATYGAGFAEAIDAVLGG